MIARGPGKTEERPGRNASVARTAWWEDEMELADLARRPGHAQPGAPAAGAEAGPPPPKGTLRRLVTLTGVSKLDRPQRGRPPSTPGSRSSPSSRPRPRPRRPAADGPTQIKWLEGFEDVHLTAPGRTLTAREQLKAKFVEPAVAGRSPPARPPPTGPTPRSPAPAPAVAAAPAPAEPDAGRSPPRAAPSRPSTAGPIGSGPRSSWAPASKRRASSRTPSSGAA